MQIGKTNKTNRLGLCALMALIASFGLNAQTAKQTPLVLNIIVEGLQDDYLTLLESQFTGGGFKKLMHEGLAMTDIDFGPGLDATAATAVLHTGAPPMVNGIPSDAIFSPTDNKSTKVLLDPKYIGNFTTETYSAKGIKVSTISDEFRIASDGRGMVYSLAADPQMSIITAGHAANAACWIYDQTGNWASSTYYKDMPTSVSNRNYQNPLRNRLDTIEWAPSRSHIRYPLLTEEERLQSFNHKFPKKDLHRYELFKLTPVCNSEITDVAIDLMTSTRMGRDANPDMLNIVYTLSYPGATRMEIMDAYLRLDMDLERLFAVAEYISINKTATIFLSGVPSNVGFAPDNAKWQIPTGEYSIKKAMSLLEMYLMAIHGNGDWVTSYNDHQFYLNHKYITDKGLDLATFRTEVAEFLARMSGISNVYTIDDIIAARVGDNPQALKRNTSIRHCGDVFVEVNPGWVIVNDYNTNIKQHRRTVERTNAVRIPAFILAPEVKASKIDTPVDARAIAPTVAQVIRIRAPNAASSKPIKVN